jgi:hypothetical protein
MPRAKNNDLHYSGFHKVRNFFTALLSTYLVQNLAQILNIHVERVQLYLYSPYGPYALYSISACARVHFNLLLLLEALQLQRSFGLLNEFLPFGPVSNAVLPVCYFHPCYITF